MERCRCRERTSAARRVGKEERLIVLLGQPPVRMYSARLQLPTTGFGHVRRFGILSHISLPLLSEHSS